MAKFEESGGPQQRRQWSVCCTSLEDEDDPLHSRGKYDDICYNQPGLVAGPCFEARLDYSEKRRPSTSASTSSKRSLLRAWPKSNSPRPTIGRPSISGPTEFRRVSGFSPIELPMALSGGRFSDMPELPFGYPDSRPSSSLTLLERPKLRAVTRESSLRSNPPHGLFTQARKASAISPIDEAILNELVAEPARPPSAAVSMSSDSVKDLHRRDSAATYRRIQDALAEREELERRLEELSKMIEIKKRETQLMNSPSFPMFAQGYDKQPVIDNRPASVVSQTQPVRRLRAATVTSFYDQPLVEDEAENTISPKIRPETFKPSKPTPPPQNLSLFPPRVKPVSQAVVPTGAPSRPSTSHAPSKPLLPNWLMPASSGTSIRNKSISKPLPIQKEAKPFYQLVPVQMAPRPDSIATVTTVSSFEKSPIASVVSLAARTTVNPSSLNIVSTAEPEGGVDVQSHAVSTDNQTATHTRTGSDHSDPVPPYKDHCPEYQLIDPNPSARNSVRISGVGIAF